MPQESWFHIPRPDQRVKRQAVGIERGGRRWSGSWTVVGGKLYVESAYGSRTVPAGSGRGQAAKAEKLLGEIVDQRVRP